MKKNEKCIQLPPIPADYDGKTVGLLWEFAKLKKESKIVINEQIHMMERIDAYQPKEISSVIENIPPEEISSYQECLRNMMVELIQEACSLAKLVYKECFIKGTDVKELMEDFSIAAEEIQIMYHLLSADDEKTTTDFSS